MYFSFILFAIVMLIILIIRRRFLMKEGFETSTEGQVGEGASGLYGWGYTPIQDPPKKKHWHWDWHRKKKHHKCPKCGYDITIINLPESACTDITQCPDFDKYVLKSSVPPCPNMNDYAKKNDLCPCVDMSQYVRKNSIEPCGSSQVWADSRYMLKTDCPSYTYTSQEDTETWLSGGKDGQWYADRNNTDWPPQLPSQPGKVLPYNAIGEIV